MIKELLTPENHEYISRAKAVADRASGVQRVDDGPGVGPASAGRPLLGGARSDADESAPETSDGAGGAAPTTA